VLPTICLVLGVLAFFAALGRSDMPRSERLPWTRWSARDVLGNAAAGVRRLTELHEHDPLTPQRRTPFHG